LLLGSVIHVGKNTVAGAGQYVIHPEPHPEAQADIAPPSNTAKHAAPSPAPATFSADADLTEATLRSRAQSLAKLVHQDTSAFPASEADGLAAELRAVSRQVLTTIANAAAIQNLVEKRAKYQTARQTLAELMATLLLAQDLDYLPTDQTVTRSEHVDQLLSTVLDSLSY
jgi:four helix bundle protein